MSCLKLQIFPSDMQQAVCHTGCSSHQLQTRTNENVTQKYNCDLNQHVVLNTAHKWLFCVSEQKPDSLETSCVQETPVCAHLALLALCSDDLRVKGHALRKGSVSLCVCVRSHPGICWPDRSVCFSTPAEVKTEVKKRRESKGTCVPA